MIRTKLSQTSRALVVLVIWMTAGFGTRVTAQPIVDSTYVVAVYPTDSPEDIVAKAASVRPHPRQLEWQKNEFIAFVHFGVNTFTGREWGDGKEDPRIFNPSELDADQWIRTMKAAGMRMVILTVKHHDGFCLWPTHQSDHSVRNSPWREGNGDVFREVIEAARREDMKVGFYLSPADLHEIERPGGRYGNGSGPVRSVIPTIPLPQGNPGTSFVYEVDDYNRFFLSQLYELLTAYGPIHEVWFDGANPKPGTGQTYAYRAWYDIVRKLQPEAVVAIKGPDVRWCGNEAGRTRQSEWSVLPFAVHPDSAEFKDQTVDNLGSREKLNDANFLYWYPSETNTSLREGWFYRDENQRVKTADEIVDIYMRSVGGNSVFLLNVTPDRRGQIPDADRDVLLEVGTRLSRTFSTNLALGTGAVLDGDPVTYWQPDSIENTGEHSFAIWLPAEVIVDTAVLEEPIQHKGQRVESFALDAWLDGEWHEIDTATTIGYRRILRFDSVATDRFRVRILSSRLRPAISTFGLYRQAR